MCNHPSEEVDPSSLCFMVEFRSKLSHGRCFLTFHEYLTLAGAKQSNPAAAYELEKSTKIIFTSTFVVVNCESLFSRARSFSLTFFDKRGFFGVVEKRKRNSCWPTSTRCQDSTTMMMMWKSKASRLLHWNRLAQIANLGILLHSSRVRCGVSFDPYFKLIEFCGPPPHAFNFSLDCSDCHFAISTVLRTPPQRHIIINDEELCGHKIIYFLYFGMRYCVGGCERVREGESEWR